ncbi:hypothetical protein CHS0354_010893 [Potamilus streckersoni]|uniref:Uncharacterized protein n=1 Tax=Potamilus streckersoni TaxID=2493646 RepID=A0AAE0SPK1_9BIVA|nr:hypothetical protein CHS0354_010893 [Potamilus streckersoni]
MSTTTYAWRYKHVRVKLQRYRSVTIVTVNGEATTKDILEFLRVVNDVLWLPIHGKQIIHVLSHGLQSEIHTCAKMRSGTNYEEYQGSFGPGDEDRFDCLRVQYIQTSCDIATIGD